MRSRRRSGVARALGGRTDSRRPSSSRPATPQVDLELHSNPPRDNLESVLNLEPSRTHLESILSWSWNSNQDRVNVKSISSQSWIDLELIHNRSWTDLDRSRGRRRRRRRRSKRRRIRRRSKRKSRRRSGRRWRRQQRRAKADRGMLSPQSTHSVAASHVPPALAVPSWGAAPLAVWWVFFLGGSLRY